jgi:hypothetical protein
MTTRCLLVVAIGSALSVVLACGGAPPPVADTSGSSADDVWIFGGEDVWIPIVDPLARTSPSFPGDCEKCGLVPGFRTLES